MISSLALRIFSLNFFPLHTIKIAHIVGNGGRRKKKIQAKNCCCIDINVNEESMDEVMTITIKSKRKGSSYGVEKARNSIQRFILEFLDDNCAKGRLLYELALLARGNGCIISNGGIVKQRSPDTDKVVWMKLLDLPSFRRRNELIGDHREFLQRNLTKCTECSMIFFGSDFDVPVKACKPYVLIYGREVEPVAKAETMLADAIRSYQQKYG